MIDDQDFNLEEAQKMGMHTILFNNFEQMKRHLSKLV